MAVCIEYPIKDDAIFDGDIKISDFAVIGFKIIDDKKSCLLFYLSDDSDNVYMIQNTFEINDNDKVFFNNPINNLMNIDKLSDRDKEGFDKIINDMVYPQIWMFCEIHAYYETGSRLRDGSYKFTYGNWNKTFEPEVFLNGSENQLNPSNYSVDYEKGIIIPNYESTSGDNMLCTYNFSWFKPETLISYVERSIGTINYHGKGAPTNYTTSDLPEGFYGISADLCFAMAMESLLLGITMWYGKLIFAVSANDLYNGGGDVASQLETIKRNC